MAGSSLARPSAMMSAARFGYRSPPRCRRWRMVLPELAGIRAVPACLANHACDRKRCAPPVRPMMTAAVTRRPAARPGVARALDSRAHKLSALLLKGVVPLQVEQADFSPVDRLVEQQQRRLGRRTSVVLQDAEADRRPRPTRPLRSRRRLPLASTVQVSGACRWGGALLFAKTAPRVLAGFRLPARSMRNS